MRFIFLGLCVAAVAFPLCASPTSDARAKIQGVYNKRDAAWNRKNAAAFLADFAPDYRMIYKGRPSSRATVARQTQSCFDVYKQTQRQTTITKLVLAKGQAITDVRESVTVTMTRPRTNRLMHLKSVGTTQDIWIMRGGKWQLKQSKVISLSATLDGQKQQIRVAPAN